LRADLAKPSSICKAKRGEGIGASKAEARAGAAGSMRGSNTNEKGVCLAAGQEAYNSSQ